jgi:hypothetical protein
MTLGALWAASPEESESLELRYKVEAYRNPSIPAPTKTQPRPIPGTAPPPGPAHTQQRPTPGSSSGAIPLGARPAPVTTGVTVPATPRYPTMGVSDRLFGNRPLPPNTSIRSPVTSGHAASRPLASPPPPSTSAPPPPARSIVPALPVAQVGPRPATHSAPPPGFNSGLGDMLTAQVEMMRNQTSLGGKPTGSFPKEDAHAIPGGSTTALEVRQVASGTATVSALAGGSVPGSTGVRGNGSSSLQQVAGVPVGVGHGGGVVETPGGISALEDRIRAVQAAMLGENSVQNGGNAPPRDPAAGATPLDTPQPAATLPLAAGTMGQTDIHLGSNTSVPAVKGGSPLPVGNAGVPTPVGQRGDPTPVGNGGAGGIGAPSRGQSGAISILSGAPGYAIVRSNQAGAPAVTIWPTGAAPVASVPIGTARPTNGGVESAAAD